MVCPSVSDSRHVQFQFAPLTSKGKPCFLPGVPQTPGPPGAEWFSEMNMVLFRSLHKRIVATAAGSGPGAQVLQLNPGFPGPASGGEVLSEIGLHLNRALSPAVTVAAAYSNGLIGYIPSKNAYPLGGYEVGGSHYYFRLPAPFTNDVEDRLVEAALRVVESMS